MITLTWAAIGVIVSFVLVIVGGIIALWVGLSSNATNIANLKAQVDDCKRDMRDHEKLNETTFTKFENRLSQDFDKLSSKIDKIYDLLTFKHHEK